MKRIKRWMGAIWIVAAGLGLLTAPAVARAQDGETPELGRDWNLRVGMFIPQSQAARSVIGDVGISFTGERTVMATSAYEVNVGISYNGLGNAYSVPIMGYIVGTSNGFRYGIGAGYSFDRRLDGSSVNGAVLGLVLGYQITTGRNALSLDLRYNFLSNTHNELDGYTLSLGIRL